MSPARVTCTCGEEAAGGWSGLYLQTSTQQQWPHSIYNPTQQSVPRTICTVCATPRVNVVVLSCQLQLSAI